MNRKISLVTTVILFCFSAHAQEEGAFSIAGIEESEFQKVETESFNIKKAQSLAHIDSAKKFKNYICPDSVETRLYGELKNHIRSYWASYLQKEQTKKKIDSQKSALSFAYLGMDFLNREPDSDTKFLKKAHHDLDHLTVLEDQYKLDMDKLMKDEATYLGDLQRLLTAAFNDEFARKVNELKVMRNSENYWELGVQLPFGDVDEMYYLIMSLNDEDLNEQRRGKITVIDTRVDNLKSAGLLRMSYRDNIWKCASDRKNELGVSPTQTQAIR